jgi:hypothetical protein
MCSHRTADLSVNLAIELNSPCLITFPRGTKLVVSRLKRREINEHSVVSETVQSSVGVSCNGTATAKYGGYDHDTHAPSLLCAPCQGTLALIRIKSHRGRYGVGLPCGGGESLG